MFSGLFRLASPGGERGALSIFIFHRVLPQPDPLFPEEPCARRFDQVCAWLRRWFRVLPLDEAVQRLAGGSLPPAAAAITFDDGYADNHDVALPILQRHGLNATFFIATGFLDGGRMWNDTVIEAVRRSTLPVVRLEGLIPGEGGAGLPAQAELSGVEQRRRLIDALIPRIKYLPVLQRQAVVDELAARAGVAAPGDLMMRSTQVQAMRSAGMVIGAHTVSHPILARLDRAEVRREIGESKAFLEHLLREPVTLFAYPNGKPDRDYTTPCVDAVRELGFEAAVSTAAGAARRGNDPLQIPRFTPWDRGQVGYGLRLLRNFKTSIQVAA